MAPRYPAKNICSPDHGSDTRRRRHAQRAAGQRYPTSRRGRLTHASRARRYRARQKNVTHQGSRPQAPNDLVSVGSAVTASKSPSASSGGLARRSAGRGAQTWHCHWCGCRCPQFVRHEFLRRRLARAVVRRGRESPLHLAEKVLKVLAAWVQPVGRWRTGQPVALREFALGQPDTNLAAIAMFSAAVNREGNTACSGEPSALSQARYVRTGWGK